MHKKLLQTSFALLTYAGISSPARSIPMEEYGTPTHHITLPGTSLSAWDPSGWEDINWGHGLVSPVVSVQDLESNPWVLRIIGSAAAAGGA